MSLVVGCRWFAKVKRPSFRCSYVAGVDEAWLGLQEQLLDRFGIEYSEQSLWVDSWSA